MYNIKKRNILPNISSIFFFICSLLFLVSSSFNPKISSWLSLPIKSGVINLYAFLKHDIAYLYKNMQFNSKAVTLLTQENNRLKDQIIEMSIKELEILTLKQKIREFSSLLHIVNDPTIENFITVPVISTYLYSSINPVLLADISNYSAISVHDLVVTPDGMVGYIRNTTSSVATIITAENDDFSISGFSEYTRINLIISGNSTKNPTITIYSSNKNLLDGELLLTSGLEGHFPRYIPIGHVKKTSKNNFVVELIEEPSTLKYVHIITKVKP